MKQVFILNVSEQQALARGLGQTFRLADGQEFEFRFDLDAARTNNGTRPRRPKHDAPTDDEPTKPPALTVTCPKCGHVGPRGPGAVAHLKAAHGVTLAQARKLIPAVPPAHRKAQREWARALARRRRRASGV